MKVLISLVILAAVIAGFYFFPASLEVGKTEQPKDSDPMTISAPELESGQAELPSDLQLNAMPTDSELSSEERQQKIEATQAKLTTLMKTFDENLKDPQQRAEIKAKIDILMAQYNELVLPIAMQKVKETRSAE